MRPRVLLGVWATPPAYDPPPASSVVCHVDIEFWRRSKEVWSNKESNGQVKYTRPVEVRSVSQRFEAAERGCVDRCSELLSVRVHAKKMQVVC